MLFARVIGTATRKLCSPLRSGGEGKGGDDEGKGGGLQHDRRESEGWTAGWPVQVRWWLRASGRPRKTTPVRRKGVGIRVVVQVTGEGGGVKDWRIQVFDHPGGGGSRLLPGSPNAPQASKYYQKHWLGGAKTQAPGSLVVQNQKRPTRHWLEPVRRQAAIEGSL